MKTWKVERTAGGRSLAEANVQRGIFQGAAKSPLLFIKLCHLTTYSDNARMETYLNRRKR